jgi:signal transduction histidine kinase
MAVPTQAPAAPGDPDVHRQLDLLSKLAEQSQRVAVLEERQRLSRELHDNVTQILSSISLMAQSLNAAWRKDSADGEQRAARLGELSQMAREEMRALRELMPCDEPLAAALARRGADD